MAKILLNLLPKLLKQMNTYIKNIIKILSNQIWTAKQIYTIQIWNESDYLIDSETRSEVYDETPNKTINKTNQKRNDSISLTKSNNIVQIIISATIMITLAILVMTAHICLIPTEWLLKIISRRLNLNQPKRTLGNILKRNPYASTAPAITIIIAFILLITTPNQSWNNLANV